jgi:hypothetical protein
MSDVKENEIFSTIDINSYFLGLLDSQEKYERLREEVKRLNTFEFSNFEYHNNDFKNLRLYLFNNFNHTKANYMGYLNLQMLKNLFYIYQNKNNAFEIIRGILFTSLEERVLLGVSAEAFSEVYSKINPGYFKTPQQYHEFIKQNDVDITTGMFVFPILLNELKTPKSNLFNIFNRFIKQYKGNSNVVDQKILKATRNTIIALTEQNSKAIVEYFENLNSPNKPNLSQEDDEENVQNIYRLDDYLENIKTQNHNNTHKKLEQIFELNKDQFEREQIMKKNNEGKFIVNYEQINNKNIHVYNNTLTIENIFTLLNKIGEYKINFAFLPNQGEHQFSLNTPKDIITRCKIKILHKEQTSEDEFEYIVSKIKYICPNPDCNQLTLLNPNQIGTKIQHTCDPKLKIITNIKENIITPQIQTPIILYKAKIQNKQTKKFDTDIYIHSFAKNLQNTTYIADIVKFYEKIDILKSKNYKYIHLLLAHTKEKKNYTVTDENKIIKTHEQILQTIQNPDVENKHKTQLKQYIKKLEQLKLKQPHKLLTILYNLRQYYKNYYNIEIDDNGMLLQLFILISFIARKYFEENKLAISIMGVGSVSKTFPTNMLGKILDDNYNYISDTARMSTAAFTGGINTSANINGIQTRKFEKGKITNNGITCFDECQNIFLQLNFQGILKSIPQEHYEISIIGGRTEEFNTTPIFLSNFNNYSQNYSTQIINAYKIKYKKTYTNAQTRKLKTEDEITNYISKINLYENIQYYMEQLKDEILANVVYAVRKQNQHNRIDWKTGSQLEAMNRILFDCVIHKKSNIKNPDLEKINPDTNVLDILLNDQDELPVEQIQNEIQQLIHNQNEPTYINIKELHKNKLPNIQTLYENIFTFLNEEKLGRAIKNHFLQNADGLDKKIHLLIIKTILTIQLTNNTQAETLDEQTKQLANIILLKCKRGISTQEYNMEHNLTEIKHYNTLDENYLVDLEDIKTQIYYEDKIEKEHQKQQYQDKQNTRETKDLDITILSDKNKEYNLEEICKQLNFENNDEQEMLEFVRKCKKNGAIYEPRNGVYKKLIE